MEELGLPDPKEEVDAGLPDRRRHGYKELEAKLNAHAADLDARFSRFVKGTLLAFAIIGLLSSAALVGFGFLLRELGTQADEIQNQRYETILRSCRDQNKHHDDTEKEFNKLSDQAKEKHPKQAKQIEEAVKANLRLIDALVPKQDCLSVVTSAVKPKL